MGGVFFSMHYCGCTALIINEVVMMQKHFFTIRRGNALEDLEFTTYKQAEDYLKKELQALHDGDMSDGDTVECDYDDEIVEYYQDDDTGEWVVEEAQRACVTYTKESGDEDRTHPKF